MEEDKKIIKDDINFLEYPNWVLDRKNKATVWTIDKEQGKYEILSPLGLPKHFDKVVLYSLLYKLHRETQLKTYVVKTSRYEIAKDVFPGVKDMGKNKYSRVMTAIKRWNTLSINFEGVFFEGDEHTRRGFHIIDEYELKTSSGALTIKFNESYIKQLKETKFYKLIDFEQYKKLHKTSSARIYEILVKNYKERSEWAINIQLLAQKLTFEKREKAQNYYPSDVLRYVKPSINEINKKTDLEIEFSYNKLTGTCVFKRVAKKKVTFKAATNPAKEKTKMVISEKQKSACIAYFEQFSAEEQQAILQEIKRQPFLEYLPDQNARIYAYMTNTKQWQPKQ